MSELQDEASAAAALRLELTATKQALADLKSQSLRTDESQMREEVGGRESERGRGGER